MTRTNCAGAGAPVVRGATVVCRCGRKFERPHGDAAWYIPEHEVPSTVPESAKPCDVLALPDAESATLPAPWSFTERGNGHVDVFAANGAYIAHVYCWDDTDYLTPRAKVDKVNGLAVMPCIGDIWRLTYARTDAADATQDWDFEVLGVGANLTRRADDRTRGQHYVMLRGIGHGDNVVLLADFRRRFKKLVPKQS